MMFRISDVLGLELLCDAHMLPISKSLARNRIRFFSSFS